MNLQKQSPHLTELGYCELKKKKKSLSTETQSMNLLVKILYSKVHALLDVTLGECDKLIFFCV